ncbi:aldehyde dehydrogenase family protein [Azohydromonas australica]|uniref:aldehyde dehydrogenase family protein n=1 Tax=Azohydromonas australica TaxID=364039 RepID=UPI000414A97A|nr:aldehyde dehydrogenase family protein [Azohydromonas australica]
MIERKQIFVDGQWVSSSGQDVITVINPATEEPTAIVPRGTAEDVDRAAQAAAAAFESWSRTPVQQRIDVFTRLARVTEDRADEITRTIVSEVGYPVKWTQRSQTAGAVEELDIIAECLREISWVEQVGNTQVCREPSGVVGAITAWNAPLRSIISKAGAAMAAGCTIVLKGAEVAPLTSFIFAEMAAEAGVPAGVLNVVCGTGPEVGEAIASHPLVDMLSLTGSVRAGQRVMELGASSVKRMHLELGGKSANIIFADADFERAVVDGIEDAMRNTGQVCGGLTRMLVPRQRLKEAEELAVRKAQSYVLGDPLDPATTLGPVATAAARERVRGYIRSGLEEGVRMLTGGPQPPEGLSRGYFVKPTIFSGDNRCRIAREEIFGPVVVIIPFDDESDAVAIANDSVYGLAAGVWCGDTDRARSIASRLRVGRVRINGAPLNKRGTHGGFKLSGVGREWGRFGIEEFLEYKSVIG